MSAYDPKRTSEPFKSVGAFRSPLRAAQSFARCHSKRDAYHRCAQPVLAVCVRVGHRGSRTLCHMRYERRNEYAPRIPLCPSCAQIMRLARVTSRFGNLPDVYTFECRGCGVTHIEAAYIEAR